MSDDLNLENDSISELSIGREMSDDEDSDENEYEDPEVIEIVVI